VKPVSSALTKSRSAKPNQLIFSINAVSEQIKLLIVEDDVDLAEMLKTYFQSHGYQVTTAAWGEDAVQTALEIVPDVAVLDIRLPDIDGYEVCRRLRQHRLTQNLPVIFLTERRDREDKLAGLELGAVDYITKPFDISELRLRLRNTLRRASLQTMNSPITGLPETRLVQERLEAMLAQPEWALVLIEINGLARFRNRYGFVAADDVARAVSLMLTNAIEESGNKDEDFIGHVDLTEFIIVTTPARYQALKESCLVRLLPSLPYFYPATDRDKLDEIAETDRLSVRITTLSSLDASIGSVPELRAALKQADV
jgi:DNA-binding response OmpR family regulator